MYILQFLVNAKSSLSFPFRTTSSIKGHEKSLHDDRSDGKALCIAYCLISRQIFLSHIETKSKRQETFSLNKNSKFCPISPTRKLCLRNLPREQMQWVLCIFECNVVFCKTCIKINGSTSLLSRCDFKRHLT